MDKFLKALLDIEAIASKAVKSETNDERTERQRVIDELINDIDPNTTNGSVILSYLNRNRTKQVD